MKHTIIIILVALLCPFLGVHAQNELDASGLVMTEQGEEIIGATVSVKEVPGKGVITDMDGRFKLTGVKPGQTIVVSYIGYKKYEQKLNKSDARMRIVLHEAVDNMDEVVVVGQGTQRKISVTGAITNVEAKELHVPATSVSNMLGSRVPGIISVTRSGEPGKDYSQFWIRGISTFGANSSALVLIDGIEGDLNKLDPEDIESFSILKDASATAVYGTRGANGVVLVTTRRGKAGKLRIDGKINVNYSYSPRMPEYVNAYEYASLANEAAVSRGLDPIFNNVDMALFKNGMDPDLHPNVDWHDVILRNHTWYQQAHFSASGGGQVARYYLSLGMLNKDGIFKQDSKLQDQDSNVKFRQYNFRANVDVNLTRTSTLTLGLETTIQDRNYPGYGDSSDALWQACSTLTPITVPLVYSSGEYPAYGADNNKISPYVLLNMTGYRQYYGNNTKLNLAYNKDLSCITKGLSATLLFNFDSNSSLSESRSKWPALYYTTKRKRDGELDLIKVRDYQSQQYENNRFVDRKYYFEAHLNYDRIFNKDHRVGGLVHYYLSDYKSSGNTTLLTAIPKRYIGLSSRLTYSYKDTYFVEGNLGYTGSEAFEKGHKFGLFPAVSGGWIPTQYKAVRQLLPWMSYLKFRLSYGEVGNDQISGSRFPYLSLMGSGSSGPWNSGSGITETQVGSNNLRWEKAVKQNLGIDMKLFGEHIDLSVDFYKDVRSGIYQQRASIPAEMGLASMPYANVGKMKSWGVDGHISYFQPLGKDAGLTLRANLTQSKNKVLEFEESIKSYPYQYTTGYTWGIQRGLVALGLFKDEEEIRNSPRQTFASDVLPGDIKYKDVNGDGVVNWDDQIPLKYSNVPEIQYGFATEVYWKNWTLSVLFGGVSHVQYYAGGSGYVPFENKETGNILKIVADQNNRWTSAAFSGDPSTERADAKFPRLSYGSNANSQVYSTFWLRNGAYLRLKNVQLTYNLDKSLVKKLYMTNASISLIGENLALWDHGDKIFDPSQASGNGAAYPLQRVFTLQINVSF